MYYVSFCYLNWRWTRLKLISKIFKNIIWTFIQVHGPSSKKLMNTSFNPKIQWIILCTLWQKFDSSKMQWFFLIKLSAKSQKNEWSKWRIKTPCVVQWILEIFWNKTQKLMQFSKQTVWILKSFTFQNQKFIKFLLNVGENACLIFHSNFPYWLILLNNLPSRSFIFRSFYEHNSYDKNSIN